MTVESRGVAPDDRPHILVHAELPSDDDVRTFYEIPETIAGEVRKASTYEGETFAGCLWNICLEREGALGEVTRLNRLLKERGRA